MILLLSITLFANNGEILKRAQENALSNDKAQVYRAYNDYKNLYVRSLMSGNEELCDTCLLGLIKTGKKLHIDVIDYERALKKRKSEKTPPKRSQPKTILQKKETPENLSSSIASQNRLVSVRWKDKQRLVLKFSRPVRKNELNSFELNYPEKKTFKKIYDLHAVLSEKAMQLKHTSVRKIRLAQFDQKTLRIVFESDSKISQQYKLSDDELVIKMSSENRELSYIPVTKKPSRKVIVIDPGHGGRDAGAVGYKKYREKVVVLQTSKKIRDILVKRGYTVYMTRNDDSFIKLRKRTRFANKKKADLFISVHANSVPKKNWNKAHGIETYFLSTNRSERSMRVAATENADIGKMEQGGMQDALHLMNREKILASNKLAIDVQRNMLGSVREKYKDVLDNGVRSGPFWVLVGAQMPAVLIELGFISHPQEATRMVDHRYQQKLALGIANGIDRYFAKNP